MGCGGSKKVRTNIDIAKSYHIPVESVESYKKVFDTFDTNKDGKICASELGRLMRSLGREILTEENLKEIIETVDENSLLKTCKKRWFVLGQKSRYLYYYKTPRDTTPAGKIDISTAVFSLDPTQPCCMQIRAGNEVTYIETPDAQARLKWLQALQDRRRAWCQMAFSESATVQVGQQQRLQSEGGVSSFDVLPDLSDFLSQNYSSVDESSNNSVDCTTAGDDQPNSVFYLNDKGELNEKSLVLLEDQKSKQHESESGEDLLIDLSADGCKQQQQPSADVFLRKKPSVVSQSRPSSGSIDGGAIEKVARIFRMSSQPSKKTCDNCRELLAVVQNLKERCMDFSDELSANKMLVESLRANLLASKNQANVMKEMANFKDNEQEQIKYIMEAESQRTYLHLQNSQQRKELNDLREKVGKMEHDLNQKSNELEAYKDSIKSKDEMIMKLVEEQGDSSAKASRIASADAAIEDILEFNGAIGETVACCTELQVADAPDRQVENMKDLLRGYETQNKFLNKEILELHNVVQSLESREQQLAKKNFEMEAAYYQLKSRYLLLLNHFQPNKELAPKIVEELLQDAKDAVLSPFGTSKSINLVDDLGFYLAATSRNTNKVKENLVDMAGQLKKASDELTEKQKKEASGQYLSWLTAWDSLLVNYTDKTLGPCPELKELVRAGIPHTYRARVWKSIVSWWTKDIVADVGLGYFDCLYKKACTQTIKDTFDPAMKQIDLDLTRTLPHNKYFEDSHAGKIESLRRVLYAFRWHNAEIGYCQGLNRLAAVSLLYLNEEDSFWTLVAIVERLQPKDYYGHTMLTAQADQRVLRDLVLDKLPKIASHLKSLEVELSLFTFNWFLTIFVDSFVHQTYLNIWDSFLYEGNKILFRFALATLKLNENDIFACKTSSALHGCLSHVGESITNFEKFSQVAFRDMNPFPSKHIESRRSYHLAQIQSEIDQLNIQKDTLRK